MHVSIKSDIKELENMRQAISRFSEENGLCNVLAYQIILAVDEICTNIIEHGFKNKPNHIINIDFNIIDERFVIEIDDKSEPFDLRKHKCNIDEHVQNYNIGGLGVFIVMAIMDEVHYQPIDTTHAYNKLTLIKNII